ncbi:histidine kinase [Kocuria flava]|uniref:sensor histidine kinase n=1 Tax=Kocuria flava TaxID=446860 RepID=UPI001FF1116A|nr:histidine kinase [Kocuria flava]MCJ8503664.1 histidine kinase [Kocuria flava]
MSTTAERQAQAPRAARKIPFFHSEPLARWLRTVLLLIATFAVLDDLRDIFQAWLDGSIDADHIESAIDSVLAYVAIGMLASRPTWAAVVSLGCLAFSLHIDQYPMAALTATVITTAVVATATRRFVTVHLSVYGAWILFAAVKHPNESIIFWSLSAVTIVGALIGSAIRYFRAQRRRAEERVRDLEILNERLREDERQALARDLHDVVAHELTLITMQTMSRRRSEDLQELHGVLETVEGAARSALYELRVLLRLLRNENDGEHPRDVTGAGLAIGSLEHVVTSLAASLTDLRFAPQVVITGDLEAMPTTARGTAARILQEAVTNIIKYAPRGADCRIEVTAADHELHLRVTNPLPRTGTKTRGGELSSGLGLRGITERVSLLGGRAEAGPEDGRWVVDVVLPGDGPDAL